MSGLTRSFQELALQLFDVGAVQFGAFKLKLHETNPAAPLSPIYFNFRTSDNPKPGPLTSAIVQRIALMMHGLAGLYGLQFEHVVGVPRAGDPLAREFVSIPFQTETLSLLQLDKSEVEGKRMVAGIKNGRYRVGQIVLLVDDLITEAHSKMEAIEVLERAGLSVRHVLVILDREQGGAKELRQRGYQLHSLLSLSPLIRFYCETGKITEEKYREVVVYLKQQTTT